MFTYKTIKFNCATELCSPQNSCVEALTSKVTQQEGSHYKSRIETSPETNPSSSTLILDFLPLKLQKGKKSPSHLPINLDPYFT